MADRFKVFVEDLSDKASVQYNIITANIVQERFSPSLPVPPSQAACTKAGNDEDLVCGSSPAAAVIDERRDEVTGLCCRSGSRSR